MAQFVCNNVKNTSTDHTLFKLNCGYHLSVFYKKDINPHSKSKLTNKLLIELKELITVDQKNLYYTQELQMQAYNKSIKPKSYAPSNKVLLNNKYIKTK